MSSLWMSAAKSAASLSQLIASARSLLDRLACTQRYHARLLAQELGDQFDVGTRPVHELTAGTARGTRAEVREAVGRHLVAAAAEGRVVVTIGNLLASEHAAAARTCDEIAAATEGLDDEDLLDVTPLLRSAVSVLARALLGALELRVLAESLDDPGRAALLARERDRWSSLASRMSIDVVSGAVAAAIGRGAGARPLAGCVVLALAEGPSVRARITAVIEGSGGSTVTLQTRAAALELLRWFRVDAVVATIDRSSDSLLHLPHSFDRASTHRPICIAILLPGAATAMGVAESFGYDAAVPLASEPEVIAHVLGGAIATRRLSTAVR